MTVAEATHQNIVSLDERARLSNHTVRSSAIVAVVIHWDVSLLARDEAIGGDDIIEEFHFEEVDNAGTECELGRVIES